MEYDYILTIEHPDKWHERFLNLAKEISTWSKDPSTKVGCIAVEPDQRRILSTGYNGFPPGIDDTDERLKNRELKYIYTVHAEKNMIYNATANGVSLSGSHVYVHNIGICPECAKALMSVGVSCVVLSKNRDKPQKWEDNFKISMLLFQEAGVRVMEI